MGCQKKDWKVHEAICAAEKKIMDSFKEAKSKGNASKAVEKQRLEVMQPFLANSDLAKKYDSIEVVTNKLKYCCCCKEKDVGEVKESKDKVSLSKNCDAENIDEEKPSNLKKKKKKKKKKSAAK